MHYLVLAFVPGQCHSAHCGKKSADVLSLLSFPLLSLLSIFRMMDFVIKSCLLRMSLGIALMGFFGFNYSWVLLCHFIYSFSVVNGRRRAGLGFLRCSLKLLELLMFHCCLREDPELMKQYPHWEHAVDTW